LIPRTAELLIDIEHERHKLHEKAKKNPRDIGILLETSKRLDKLIIEYQKLTNYSHRQEE